MFNQRQDLIVKTQQVMNPDLAGNSYSPAQVRDIVSHFPPPNFIGKAVPAVVSTRLNRFIWIDDGITDLIGYAPEEFLSQSLTEWLPCLHTPEHGMIIGEIFIRVVEYLHKEFCGKMDVQINVDQVFLRKDGDRKRIMTHLWPLEWDRACNLTMFGVYY